MLCVSMNYMEVESAKLVAAAIAVGLGGIGPGLGEGIIAGQSLAAIGRNPEASNKIMPFMFATMAVAESTAIYALVVALLILFVF